MHRHILVFALSPLHSHTTCIDTYFSLPCLPYTLTQHASTHTCLCLVSLTLSHNMHRHILFFALSPLHSHTTCIDTYLSLPCLPYTLTQHASTHTFLCLVSLTLSHNMHRHILVFALSPLHSHTTC